jgi:molecular chaperone DnaK (HSP70)
VVTTRRYIGVDFGTSNTVVRYMDYCEEGLALNRKLTRPLPVEIDHSDIVKTVILERPDGTCEFGHRAEASALKGTLHRNFKMDLASEDETRRSAAERLMAQFFLYLRKGCDSYLDALKSGDLEYTYVSYPAKWSSQARTAVEKCARNAGFRNVTSIDEPSAALHACLQERIGENSLTRLETLQTGGVIYKGTPLNIMLLDLGAGTTDIVLSRYTPGESTVTTLVTWPLFTTRDTFGGREVDQCLLGFVLRYLKSVGATISPSLENSFLASCKRWKDNSLSANLDKCGKSEDEPDLIGQALSFQGLTDATPFPGLDRQQLETELGPYLDTLPRLVNGAIQKAVELSAATGIRSADDVDLLILTGGHSQWYFVREMLMGRFTAPGGDTIDLPKIRGNEKRLLQLNAPEQTVAMGLAFQGNPLKFRNVMSNNVWMSLKVGSSKLPTEPLVKQQTLLPYEFEFPSRSLVFQYELDQFIPIMCTIHVGEIIENAIQYEVSGRLDQGLFNTFIDKAVEFFSETLHSTRRWTGNYSIGVNINENQRGNIVITTDCFGTSASVQFEM